MPAGWQGEHALMNTPPINHTPDGPEPAPSRQQKSGVVSLIPILSIALIVCLLGALIIGADGWAWFADRLGVVPGENDNTMSISVEEGTDEAQEGDSTTEPPDPQDQTDPSFEAIAPLEGTCGSDNLISRIRATDRYTVEFILCRPDTAFREKIVLPSFGIQSSEWLEQTGGAGELLDHPIGTGPYLFDQWSRGEFITFTRFDDYWGEKAFAETLMFRWSAEGAVRLLEIQSGAADGTNNVGPEDVAEVQDDQNLQLLTRPALNVAYIGFTASSSDQSNPLSNQQVRQAIAMGIDRQRIVDVFYPPGAEVASYFVPCSIPNACQGDPWYEWNPDQARALLVEAGYPDGFSTKLYYRDVVRLYLPEASLVAQDIQIQLQENLGIDAEIVVMESGEFIEKSTTGQLTDGMYLLGWGADYPHVTNFLDYHFGRSNPQFGDPHPEIYKPLEAAAALTDAAQAQPYYIEANNAIRELVPVVPIAHSASSAAFRADVSGAHTSPVDIENFALMQSLNSDSFTWIQQAEPITLYCADESDGESMRACAQVVERLLAFDAGGVQIIPALATSCEPNEDQTVWACQLREGVLFHDGTTFDANDVVFNFSVMLDTSNPLHIGNTGSFDYAAYLFGLIVQP
jgi:peptide/nickel transport system substrate-binding protein